MAAGANLHCQAQFTVTLATRPVVRVSAHTTAYITKKTAPLQGQGPNYVMMFWMSPESVYSLLCHISLSLSSSGVNTLSGSFPKSNSSQYSDLGVARTPLCVDQSPDSGFTSTPVSGVTHTHTHTLTYTVPAVSRALKCAERLGCCWVGEVEWRNQSSLTGRSAFPLLTLTPK